MAAPLCSVVFAHDFFADEFADVRHGGAYDTWMELNRHWLTTPKPVPMIVDSQGHLPARLNLRDIHFMQNNISNNYADGKYTVVGNARAMRDGKLDPDSMPPIGVWKDASGKIWTMDHRRLAAMILSGKVESAKVRWVTREEVLRQRYKMSTLSDGNYLLLTAKRNQSVLVERPDMKGLGITKIKRINIPQYLGSISPPELKQTVWKDSAGLPTAALPHDILFSTTVAKDESALTLSISLKSAPSEIPVLRVWSDSTRRIWTVDNDVLAALRLSGHQSLVELRFLTQAEYKNLNAKVDSQTGGRSYIIPLKEGNSALVVHQ